MKGVHEKVQTQIQDNDIKETSEIINEIVGKIEKEGEKEGEKKSSDFSPRRYSFSSSLSFSLFELSF